jgi:hypothetical protein
MPDQTPTPQAPATQATTSSESTPSTSPSGPTIHIGDEFGTAKRNLPPVGILLLATAGILIIVGIYSFSHRAKPQAAGSLDSVVAVDLPGQNAVLAALTFTLHNSGEKALWVHEIQGKVVGTSGEQSSDAVSAVDFDRYFQGFPALKAGAQPALAPEDKLQPGQEVKRTVMISFPVNLETFNRRRSISVIIQPYDQPVPVVLTK